MTYISGIYQGPNTTSTSTTETKSSTLGQDDFLTLLVAQLQNQDPLNPSDPTEFTSQLAQFSELEQLFNLNDAMDNLANAQGNAEKLSALSLIGKEVLVEGSSFTMEEGPVEIGYSVEGSAEDITLLIQNSSGETVGRLRPSQLSAGNHFVTWSGQDEDGNALPAGKYAIVVQAESAAEGETVSVSTMVRSEVTGVDLSSGSAKLITAAGEFGVLDIHGVYDKNTTAATAASTVDEAASSTATGTAETSADSSAGSFTGTGSGNLNTDFNSAVAGLSASRENLSTLAERLQGMGYDAEVYNQESYYGYGPFDKLTIDGQLYDVLAVEDSTPSWNPGPVPL